MMKVGIIKLGLSNLFFVVSFAAIAPLRGGDVVNNGGGLSEQALLYSALNYPSFLNSCLQYSNCGAGLGPLHEALLSLKSCPLPQVIDLQFATEEDLPSIAGKPFANGKNGGLIVNRKLLYPADSHAMTISESIGYLSRIYLDYCKVIAFSESQVLAATLQNFADFDSEQVTIGKDNLNLPKSEWIRTRTLYSDLIIEAKQSVLRLSCPTDDLNQCSLNGPATIRASRFKNLNLVIEKRVGDDIQFDVEGFFISPTAHETLFHFSAQYHDGLPVKFQFMGRNLPVGSKAPKN